jgi:hypothetical protein
LRPERLPAPPRSVEPGSEELLVWADWLQARGHTLGELAMLWSLPDDDDEAAELRREQIDRVRAKIEQELVSIENALEVRWSGPLIQRVRLHVGRLRGKHDDGSATLERVLGSHACVRLDELELQHVKTDTLTHLLALAQKPDRDPNAHAALAGLTSLAVASWDRVEFGALLAVLPNLQQLTCRTREIGFGQPHLGLRALTLALPGFDNRSHARLFSACDAATMPSLRELTLELPPRWTGRPLPFERMSLPPRARVTLRGPLREADIEGLMRWAVVTKIHTLEIADPQRLEVERHAISRAARAPRLRLLGLGA